jgi:hypothetical protein
VFYELGLAHALGKPVVLLAQKADDVPADLRAIRWIKYERVRPRWAAELQRDISDALQEALKGGVQRGFAVPADRTLTERLLSMSGTQKRILDHLRWTEELEPLSRLSRQFQKGDSEMFYRLEALRLLGFVRLEPGVEPAYGLTPELRRVWRGQTPP